MLCRNGFQKGKLNKGFSPNFWHKRRFYKVKQAKGTHCKAFLPSFPPPYTHGRLTFEVSLFSGLYRILGTI